MVISQAVLSWLALYFIRLKLGCRAHFCFKGPCPHPTPPKIDQNSQGSQDHYVATKSQFFQTWTGKIQNFHQLLT